MNVWLIAVQEDDAPPADPRLAKPGGKLDYINVDFHHPRSRLRQTPYLLRPYTYDPKTSLGPGPPTQVLVTGFDPLHSFSNVSAIFSSFGEVAESSNKLHPETGSCLGFATFRYRDSKMLKNVRFVSAIEAAKTAVRKGPGVRIGSHNVKVEFDPEGNKSRRMLENILKKSRETPTPQFSKPSAKPAEKTSGPPPTAPKGPSGSRPLYRPSTIPPPPISSAAPVIKSRYHRHLETLEPLAPQYPRQPYLFVPHECVPVMETTPPHMRKRMSSFEVIDVYADKTGYFCPFPDTQLGRYNCQKCFSALNGTMMFSYKMYINMYLYGSNGRPVEGKFNEGWMIPGGRSYAPYSSHVSRRRSPSPGQQIEAQRRKEFDDRRKEEEADWEEEKRERAKNFDPSREAIEVIRKELKDQLVRNIRTKMAAPILFNFMDPSNHVAKRRKLNIADPKNGKLPLIHEDDSRDNTPSSTPNSRADTERPPMGGARLNVSSLPRIRKVKKGKKPNVGFQDPFGRSRPETKKPVYRPLMHRFIHSDDEDSDDDTESRSRVKDTEEPDSRPRSRMTSEDSEVRPVVKDDTASVDTRDEDSMSEANFVEPVRPKKRKLDLQVEAARKLQKKTDEELFGVAQDKIEEEFPLSATTVGEDTHMQDIDAVVKTESEVEAAFAAGKKKVMKTKKKSKRQVFEEREALKRQSEGIYLEEAARESTLR